MSFDKSQRLTNTNASIRVSTSSIWCLALRWSSIFSVLFSFHSFATAAQVPTPFTAHYQVTKGVMSVGSTKRTLHDKGNGQFMFESVTKPGGIAKLFTRGKVVERSHWRLHNNKLVPHEYTYQNSSEQKRNVKLLFDWEKYQVTNIINGDPWKMDLEENTLDKLLYQLAIMYDLSEGKNNLNYKVADGGVMKSYDIKITGIERVSIDLGDFDTVKVVVSKSKRQTTLWCAKELQFLPVRIEQRKKEDDGPVTANLIELEGIPLPNRKVYETDAKP
ncbi:DUF3108 domain-containing protein [Kaarinaea lacus]